MDKEQCFYVGKLLKTHGLKGEISVFLDVDYPEEYEELEQIYVETKRGLTSYEVEGVYFFEKKVVFKLKGIEKIEDASKILGCDLYLPLDFLPPIDEGGFYYHDVIGFDVVDENLGKLGKVLTFYEGGAQDLMEMEYQGKLVLVPLHDEIVKRADMASKSLITCLPDGLIEVYFEEPKPEQNS
jgi:16S rRNA processing protein RimM